MTTIKIIWSAFGQDDSLEFKDDSWYLNDLAVCEMVFRDTNLYSGPIWDLIKDRLPAYRSHTALSVGDYVVVNGNAYRCNSTGWSCALAEEEIVYGQSA